MNQDSPNELISTIQDTTGHTCGKCNKAFFGPKAAQALSMHKMRVHTRAGVLGAKRASQMRRRSKYKSRSAAQQADYLSKRASYLRIKARYAAQGLNAHGQPYKIKSSALRNIQLAQRRRRKREAITPRSPKWVYPLPEHAAPEQVSAAIKFCPNCGHHLEKYL